MTILNYGDEKIKGIVQAIEDAIFQTMAAAKQTRDKAQAVRLSNIRVRLEDSLSRIRERAGTSRKTRHCCNPTM
ncbi:MAG: hypothetical protein MRK02_11060 [Candidatus Scalindua sp.]|nr:hypothetical protein [Candidatus Scalindua sp.]